MLLPKPRQRSSRRQGAVLPWLVVCLGVILSVVAIGLDGGRMMQERRRCQDAADAAAIAAGTDMYLTYATSLQTNASHSSSINAALAAAAQFGYANDQTNSIVTVNIPPTSGTFAGKANYVETIVQSNLKGSFGVSLTGQNLIVRARSVAKGRPMAIGLFALSPNASGALSISGNAAVTVNDADVTVNSTSALALSTQDNARLTASSINVVSNTSLLGLSLSVTASAGVDPTPDPLVALPEPDQTTATIQRTSVLSYSADATHTLSPGIYRGGISLSGNSNTTLQPGIYVLQGGLSVSGNATLTGTGVLIFNTYTDANPMGAFSVAGNGSVNLSAATSGTYQGIVFYQDRDAASPPAVTIAGNANTQIGGVLYAPTGTVSINSNASTSGNILGGGILASTIAISGNGAFTIDGGSNLPQIPQINLVE
jgi:hypothetical protein